MFQEDEVDIEVERQAFNRESFKRLIKRTFQDYHPNLYNRECFDLDQYLALVAEE